MSDHGEDIDAARAQAAAEERAACVELARAAGCICTELAGGGQAKFRASGHYRSVVQFHDPRCPAAILAAIEARGRG